MSALPADPLFSLQWHLRNTGQQTSGLEGYDTHISRVWSDYTGRGVLLAVIDDGFDETHPDLVGNYRGDLSYDFEHDRAGAAATKPSDSHGTATLGLIVASNNGIGGVGVAYGAEAAGYRMNLDDDTSAPEMLSMFTAASQKALSDGVAITSNSWGTTTEPFDNAELQSDYMQATANLAQSGRDGLGIINVFAGGNSREEGSWTAYDPVANSPYAIVVAAAKANGTITSYSTPGASILVAAPGSDPSSIVTTDRQGPLGYNTAADGDYTNSVLSAFSGTSAAAPVVAGVVALMLEANPHLGYRDVQEILAYSAKSSAVGAPGYSDFVQNRAVDWNGGGLYVSHDSGYGNVDALAAVRLAETWTKSSTYENLATADAQVNTLSATIDAGQQAQFRASFDTDLRIQHILLTIELETTDLSGVTLGLIGPDGRNVSQFIEKPAGEELPATLSFTFDTTHYWGESTLGGDWAMAVQNANAATTIKSWSIQALGDSVDVNKTYVYTDEYGYYSSLNTHRGVLESATGQHTINASAVTTDSVIDLRAGMVGSLANTAFTVADDTVISRVYAGDGNDTLSGDEHNNILFGGRGNNFLDGGDGVDTAGYIFSRASYSITYAGGGLTVTDIQRGTADILRNMEFTSFAEGALSLRAASDQAISVGGLYQGLLGRGMDSEGLRYWTDLALDHAVSLSNIAQGFITSEEFRSSTLAGATDHQFVEALYNQLLDRSGEEVGVDFWLSRLTAGAQRGDIALEFLASDEFRADHMSDTVRDIASGGNIWA